MTIETKREAARLIAPYGDPSATPDTANASSQQPSPGLVSPNQVNQELGLAHLVRCLRVGERHSSRAPRPAPHFFRAAAATSVTDAEGEPVRLDVAGEMWKDLPPFSSCVRDCWNFGTFMLLRIAHLGVGTAT